MKKCYPLVLRQELCPLYGFKGAAVERLKPLRYFPFPHLYFSFDLAFGESDSPFSHFYPTNIYVN